MYFVTLERITLVMDNKNFKDQCTDLTKEFNLQIPCGLAERVESYASANNATIVGVVIEALDTFLSSNSRTPDLAFKTGCLYIELS